LNFYNFARDGDGSDVLTIDGEIASEESWWGGTVLARKFRGELGKCKAVTVWINSPGGDVFAAAEIYTALKEHPHPVTVKVAGIAASAASLVAMAGDTVLMSPVATMMIHDPWTWCAGNARDLEHWAVVLREIGEGLVAAYAGKTHKSWEEIRDMLASETYMNAQRCVDEGFADGVMSWENMTASGASAAMARAPVSSAMRGANYAPAAICAKLKGVQTLPATVFGKLFDMPGRHTHSGVIVSHNHQDTLTTYYPLDKAEAVAKAMAAARLDIEKRARIMAEAYAV